MTLLARTQQRSSLSPMVNCIPGDVIPDHDDRVDLPRVRAEPHPRTTGFRARVTSDREDMLLTVFRREGLQGILVGDALQDAGLHQPVEMLTVATVGSDGWPSLRAQ